MWGRSLWTRSAVVFAEIALGGRNQQGCDRQRSAPEAKVTARLELTFATRIDIPEPQREELVALLNARLADTFDL